MNNHSGGIYLSARVDEPYPAVNIAEKNCRYAAIISDGYAGKGSETTAIAQYGVHRLYLKNFPGAYEAYKAIVQVEMIHFSLLGDLVLRLGIAPILKSCVSNSYWNGSSPMYRNTFEQIVQSDIDGEKDAIAHYQRMSQQIADPQIQNLFRRIILDEERHIEILTHLPAPGA